MGDLINVTISSTSAGERTLQVNTNMKVHALLSMAMARLELDPSMAKQYVLVFNGKVLPDDSTLEELGIGDKAVLLLEPRSPEVI
ncbi:MAG: ubiquitin family protein [Acidobacteria bacterium]|nr:ubiquitin family protein [Acidobacteriota bacterium]